MAKAHLALTIVWVVMIIPGVLLWRDSVPFLVAVSIYANAAGHWAAYEGEKAKKAAEKKDNQSGQP
jgi:hypothetical protein